MQPSQSSSPPKRRPALSLVAAPPPDVQETPESAATKLGLYLGYDRARVALGRLASELSRSSFEATSLRSGVATVASRDELQRGASAAAFAAFTLVCEQAEDLRRELCERWPELRADLGGPVPVRGSDEHRSQKSE